MASPYCRLRSVRAVECLARQFYRRRRNLLFAAWTVFGQTADIFR